MIISEYMQIGTIDEHLVRIINRNETPEEMAKREAEEAEMRRQEEEAFWALSYGERVEKLIRERYTSSDELAILRQRDSKPEEFADYNAFAEDCKVRAKMT